MPNQQHIESIENIKVVCPSCKFPHSLSTRDVERIAASKNKLPENTTWINTMHKFAEPKQWVALPVYFIGEEYVYIIDANGEQNKIAIKRE